MVQRAHWENQCYYFFFCVGFVVNLDNLWRFPYLVYNNGGGVFVVVYVIFVVVVGIPLLVLELALGQFTSTGSATCWEFCPIVKGLGLAMNVYTTLRQNPLSAVTAWTVFFLINSLAVPLPWDPCSKDHRGDCLESYFEERLKKKCLETVVFENETCHINGSLQRQQKLELFRPAEHFEKVIGLSSSYDLANLGPIQVVLAIFMAAVWAEVLFFISIGVRYVGKVVSLSVIYNFIAITLLLLFGLSRIGAGQGILSMFRPDFHALITPKLWIEAAVHVVHSLALGSGAFIMFASYNKFKNNFLRDAVIVAIWDTTISLIASMVVAAYAGALAHSLQLPFKDIIAESSGTHLVFGVLPLSLFTLTSVSLWSTLYFLLILSICADDQILGVAILLSGVIDCSPQLKDRGAGIAAALSLILFAFSIPMVTMGGKHVFDMYHRALYLFPLAATAVECIAIAWCYGASRFINDISIMLGVVPFWGSTAKRGLDVCWSYICPGFCLASFLSCAILLRPYENMEHMLLTWTILTLGAVLILVTALCEILLCACRNRNVINPTDKWGPALPRDYMKWAKNLPDTPVDMEDSWEMEGQNVSSSVTGVSRQIVSTTTNTGPRFLDFDSTSSKAVKFKDGDLDLPSTLV